MNACWRTLDVAAVAPDVGNRDFMAEGHDYGPGPWVDHRLRADWTTVYHHRAQSNGLVLRSSTGSKAVSVANARGGCGTCSEKFLRWVHHAPWMQRSKSGRTTSSADLRGESLESCETFQPLDAPARDGA